MLLYLHISQVFIVSGLWHGAAWTFVLWGGAYGVIMVFERLFKTLLEKIPKVLRIAATFITVNFLWVLFRAESFMQAVNMYRGLFNFKNINIGELAEVAFDSIINFPTAIDIVYLFSIIAILLFIVFKAKNSEKIIKEFKLNVKTAVFSSTLFVISLLHLLRESVFIYFNF